MGQYLGRIEADTAKYLKDAESSLAQLTKSKEWEMTKTGADVTGILDPSPASDAVSMSMSIAEGDWVGAFLSGVSYIPYFGDAAAKPFKIARATKTITSLERRAAALAKTVAHYKSAATRIAQRKMAAAAERARRAKEAGKRYAEAMKKKKCPNPPNRWGTHLPRTGTWKSGVPGEGRWVSKDGKVSVEYKEGYPDFSTSVPPSVAGKVEIEMTGNESTDFRMAREAMRKQLGDPKWPGNARYAPKGYTWHHVEDGATMQLVKSDVHNKAVGGAPHVGGTSIVSSKDSEF